MVAEADSINDVVLLRHGDGRAIGEPAPVDAGLAALLPMIIWGRIWRLAPPAGNSAGYPASA